MPAELVPIYRDKIIPLADVVTPNQFEAELLSESKITDFPSALTAIDRLHGKGIRTVVISSTELNFATSSDLVAIASSTMDGTKQQFKISMPRLDASFIGTGDLFAALFLAWFTKSNFDLKLTLEHVVATLQAVIKRTYKYAEKLPGGLESCANIELKIVQGRGDILDPVVDIVAEKV